MCGCGIRRRRPAGLQALSKEVVAPCACESRALARSRLSPARQAAASRVTDARTMCGDAAGARWRRRAAASSSRATTATMRRIWPQMPAAWRWKGHPPTTWAATASLRVRSRGSLYIYYMCTHTHTHNTHTQHTHIHICMYVQWSAKSASWSKGSATFVKAVAFSLHNIFAKSANCTLRQRYIYIIYINLSPQWTYRAPPSLLYKVTMYSQKKNYIIIIL
jgi:hypothetical protein